MQKRVTLKIYGRVQGVFFRDSARREARKLDLAGFVCNEADGSVYAVVEGEEEKLKEFIKWCHKGPIFAKVEKVEIKYENPTGEFSDFCRK